MRKILLSFLFLGAFTFFLPYFASIPWTKKQAEERLSKQLGGEVKIQSLSLSWLSTQKCQNVQWTNLANGYTLEADQIVLQEGLIQCLRYKESPLNVQVTGASMKTKGNFRFIKKMRKKKLDLAFSPIQATVQNGVIAFDKIQIDINEKMHVTTKGEIDLTRNHMEIVLGLRPETLGKIFKEAKNLPDEFELEIPISTQLSGKALEKALIGFFLKNYAKVTSLHK
ncbi:MAG: hypothetical protein P0S96_03990 [Simkaniaceae bacterium]|nr:hypothetical protein [Candidatus Sacchlamyda saccharinae]